MIKVLTLLTAALLTLATTLKSQPVKLWPQSSTPKLGDIPVFVNSGQLYVNPTFSFVGGELSSPEILTGLTKSLLYNNRGPVFEPINEEIITVNSSWISLFSGDGGGFSALNWIFSDNGAGDMITLGVEIGESALISGFGNILIDDSILLDDIKKFVTLYFDGVFWRVVSSYGFSGANTGQYSKTVELDFDSYSGLTHWRVPEDIILVSYELVAFNGEFSDIKVELWVTDFSNYPPTPNDNITGFFPITNNGGYTNFDDALIGWETSLNKGDYVVFYKGFSQAVGQTAITINYILR